MLKRIMCVLAVLGVLLPVGVPAHAATTVRFDFDDGVEGESGGITLRIRGDAGTIVSDARAVRFRARGKAILEGTPGDLLNPGFRNFSYGASVKLTRAQVRRGANLVQKGFANSGTQFKLQIDNGKPSCVLAGQWIHRAQSSRSIDDGSWHDLSCERTWSMLILRVDGVRVARASVPAGLGIANRHPLRIGGKNLSDRNDQYVGLLDSVYITMS